MPPEAAAALQPGGRSGSAAWSQAGAPLKAAGQWPAVGMRERAASTVETRAREEAREPLAPHVWLSRRFFGRRGRTIDAGSGGPEQCTSRAAIDNTKWKLVWSDEFDKDGAPDSSNWGYEKGFVRNSELQWYQPDNARCRADCSPSPRRSNKS